MELLHSVRQIFWQNMSPRRHNVTEYQEMELLADTQEEEKNSGNGFYSKNFWSWDLDAGDDCGEEFEIGL